MILVLDLTDEADPCTSRIPGLAAKLEEALPGILPDADDSYAHVCGSGDTEHAFREEIERGTSVTHLLEHVILRLLGRTGNGCSGLSGQRSIDLERGITSRYYVVADYTDKVQASVAADLALQLVSAWMAGRTVKLEAETILKAVHDRIAAMLTSTEA